MIFWWILWAFFVPEVIQLFGGSLIPRMTAGAEVSNSGGSVRRLTIPKGPKGIYRLAQLDDYMQLDRTNFRWEPNRTSYVREYPGWITKVPGVLGFGMTHSP